MTRLSSWILSLAMCAGAAAQQGGAGPTALTIYNQDFAVARTTVDLNLAAGPNQITTTNVTRQVEPDSVVLRDPTGKTQFSIGEQNYENGVVNQENLLQKYEGQTIQFARGWGSDGKDNMVSAKIIRGTQQPIVEINGVLEFQLPGTPLFPASADTLLLKPTLRWQIFSAKAAHVSAELAYITRGLSWQATYNIVAPESKDVTAADRVDVVGWVTIQNHTGTEFPEAKIKLMAGDVAKLSDQRNRVYAQAMALNINSGAQADMAPMVTQQAFDDFHLYDLNRTVALRWEETKQVQFLEASNVTMSRIYEYDGGNLAQMSNFGGYHNIEPTFATTSNPHVNVRAEIKNSVANHLGLPLPGGRIRLYRRDTGGQMEFIGEGTISHTPTDETVKVPVGNAFDVTGERKQTSFHVDQRAHTIDETYEVTVKNQKATPVKVAVVEHLNRGQNWELTAKSTDYTKRDSNTIEFPITVPAAGELKVAYSVRYTW
jgi:hypothetical protein